MLAEIVPAPGVLAAYTLACFVPFITPGPDMSLFLAMTIAGRRWRLSAACGLATAFNVFKAVGAVYLLWLAVDAVWNGSALRVKETERQEISPWSTFLLSFGVNLTNPKIVLFFLTFLPQFVDAGTPNAAGQLVFVGFYFVVFTTPLGALLVLGAERTLGALTGRPGVMRAIDYIFAGVFGAFTLRVATMPGR